MKEGCTAKRLDVYGIVQGVGFRPFVFQLAHHWNLKGTVANTSSGVSIRVEGPENHIMLFCRELKNRQPPLAQITDIEIHSESLQGFKTFSIIKSKDSHSRATLISPDISICDDCLRELRNPNDRRYQYPFINCTHCGPRYTIIRDIPYDRPNTSMQSFKMCERCQQEYDDPDNRRFHAQPNACSQCGPQVRLCDKQGSAVTARDPIRQTADLLKSGHIVAIKGLGGFHLAADAENPAAVATLRKRKHRAEKPFALMSHDVDRIRSYARISAEEEAALTSCRRPIVLLKKRTAVSTLFQSWMETVAPGNRFIGVMLPYTPLHYLLLAHGFTALVMTSGNKSEEPIAIDNREAFASLAGIADYFLIHNRDIYLRCDDSIVKPAAGALRFIRRSRGYVPEPVFLNSRVPPVLACGGGLKSTICLTRENQAFISQHIGDIENPAACNFFQLTVDHLKRILNIEPEIIAYDLHPDYLSSAFALQQEGVRKIGIQHHHAHIVSCMVENRLDGPVIGLAFDGTGYGSDGHIWGGEVLITEKHGFQRAAHLEYVPMPGSQAAIREPWRMALSYLFNAYGDSFRELDLPLFHAIEPQAVDIVTQMVKKEFNAPRTSSLGRLFDGITAILGIRKRVTFEGQAAMDLETVCSGSTDQHYDYEWEKPDTASESGACRILTGPLIRGIVKDIQNGIEPPAIAARFHMTLVFMFGDLCRQLRKDSGLNRVVLSGGVFQNSFLLAQMTQRLEKNGFEVFSHTRVPTNDGGISLGQAIAAAAVANAI